MHIKHLILLIIRLTIIWLWCSVAGKVTVCLAPHWSWITDSVVYILSTYGLNGLGKGDEQPAYAPLEYYGIFTFTFIINMRNTITKVRQWKVFPEGCWRKSCRMWTILQLQLTVLSAVGQALVGRFHCQPREVKVTVLCRHKMRDQARSTGDI